MPRYVFVRRFVAALLVVVTLVGVATASPVLAAGRAAPPEPGGFLDRLVSWVVSLWTAASGLPELPAGTEGLDGGCIVDPSGSCHGAATPPGDQGS